jgi:hypothetical protein
MSAVYLAERVDERFEEQVAVKVMAAHLAGKESLRRFTNEGRFLSFPIAPSQHHHAVFAGGRAL